ncbi:MAG: glucosyltransferase domain-containing protein [Lachnospiraceae bacterium]|nr:glucosyltransferase domain-containing protein [Lachnospiraceae bacterium]
MDRFKANIKKNDISTFLSVIITGLIAHGYIFTHNIILHDNTYNFYLGATYPFGRWMIEVVTRITNLINGQYVHFSTPLYLGVLSLIYIAVAAVIIERLFDVKSPLFGVLIGAMMVSFPMVTSLMGFMFMSAINMFGMLLSIIGSAIIIKYRKWYAYIGGVIILACGAGIYQAYICTFICMFLIYFFFEVYKCQEENFLKWFFIRVLYYGGACIAALVSYLAIMKFFLWHYHTELSDYQGMSSAASTTISQYIDRIIKAYTEFFTPVKDTTRNMYQGGNYGLYRITILIVIFLGCFVIGKTFKKKEFKKAVCLLLLFLIIPLGVNFIYVMCDVNVHSVMMYAEVFFFIFAMLLMDTIRSDDEIGGKCQSILYGFLAFVILSMVILNCRFSNTAYLRGEYIQNAGIEYFNRMVTRIESVDGYDPNLFVAFVGDPVPDQNLFAYPEFGSYINVYPFSLPTVIYNYNWHTFMKATVGYNPPTVDLDYLKDSSAVDSMPCYPSDGSVRIIEDVVVVKFQ